MILINSLAGEIIFTKKITLDGSVPSKEVFSINGNVINGGAKSFPDYEGEYTITPSSEVQILETEKHSLQHDIVINPIPSNYGLITWNGSYLMVS